MLPVEIAIIILSSYMIGSIPVGYLVCKSKGIDIREVGSGNIGATNVGRALGTKWKIITLFVDAFKGGICVYLTQQYFEKAGGIQQDVYPIIAGMSAIAGHNWTIFLKFKGGKGVATSAGAMSCLAPIPLLVGIAAYLIVVKISKYVSLGSMISTFVVVLCIIFDPYTHWKDQLFLIIYATIIWLLVLLRHKDNIKRLINGEESKIVSKT
ncbi:MAG: acyl-phosphate glycerol 3-phosphate acyltransferase [Planctomycetota bacterium]|nr:MAG: acyl-phosphate glycerol 3-phosphate acyltransferase [Planctomycetota bacterium]